MEAGSLAVKVRVIAPLTSGQHLRFVVFVKPLATVLALILRRLWPVLLPLQPAPLKVLKLTAARTRHPKLALIRLHIFRLDLAEVLHRWRRGQQDLAPRKRCRPAFS